DTPPRPEWMLELRSYFHGHFGHAFAADAAGLKLTQNNLAGRSPSHVWHMGNSLAENRIDDLKKICGAAHKLKKLYFTRTGNNYNHEFGVERRGFLRMGCHGTERLLSPAPNVQVL
ncbi:hypothetical protein PFISCL1PPCAC_3682, partial [Pristionchus fissidentatus]